MKAELQKQLYERYPSIFADKNKRPTETLICFGCECGGGWFDLLDECCAELTRIEEECGLITKVVQIKEKYGTLRFYVTGDHDYTKVAFESNTRYWLHNIFIWMQEVGEWSDKLIPWQEYYGQRIEKRAYTKAEDGTKYDELVTLRDYDTVIATPWVKVKHATIKFVRSHIWYPISWFLDDLATVHYRRDYGPGIHLWHRWNPKKWNKLIRMAIDKAEERSAETCEECGEPGTLDDSQWWVYTLCPVCKAKRAVEDEAHGPITPEQIIEKLPDLVAEGKRIADEIEARAKAEEAKEDANG